MTRLNKTIFTLLLVPVIVVAQQLDEDFLKTLPANLQADFLAQSESKNDRDKNFPNPETRINNLEQALENAEQTLENIKKDLNQTEFKSNELIRIGSNFFQTFQSTFLPINEPNADANYILDVGDQLTLQFIGQKNVIHILEVKRDGAINIPDIGNVTLVGLTLQEATELVKNTVYKAFIGVEAFISLSELRDINVLIVGNARKPGMYTLSGGSSPLSLLYAAGGIDDNGSFRRISHKRNNKEIQTIDLYEVLLKGNLAFSHQLRSGDVLVVNPRYAEVRVSGSFANPGIYEVLPSENLDSIIKYAGIQQMHTDSSILLERYDQNAVMKIAAKPAESSTIKLIDGDSISLFGAKPQFKKTKSITITGEVNVPGIYEIQDTTTILELIRLAGSYTDQAYPLGGVLIREKVKELEIASKEKSYNEIIRFLVASPKFSTILTSPDSKGIITFLSLLKDYEPVGRVTTEFSLAKLETNPSLNRILEDGDVVYIPSFSPDIYVFGEVLNPGPTLYREMATPHDYITAAGDLTRVADKDRILLISPSGDVEVINDKLFRFLQSDRMVLPGSTIYVPMELGKLDGINLASTIAPIVGSVALSLASLNSINK